MKGRNLLIPICFDRVGSRDIVPAWLYAEEMRVNGMSAADLVKRLETKVAAPREPGFSPMISPTLRTYMPNGEVGNINLPHYMYYGPNKAVDEVVTRFSPTHPFLSNDGAYGARQAYMIQALGAAEIAAINAEYAEMLQDLCDARADGAYCLDMSAIDTRLRTQLSAALQALGN